MCKDIHTLKFCQSKYCNKKGKTTKQAEKLQGKQKNADRQTETEKLFFN